MKKERNYGIDLLRIAAMFFVCLLHVLRFGGILGSAKPLSAQYEIAWFLETAAYCAVNCYALISGYVGLHSRFKLSNLIELWLQVAFYSFGFYALSFLFNRDRMALSTVVKALLPASSEIYWYFTSYFCAFFFFPLINWLINNMPRAKARLGIYACLFLFCAMTSLRHANLFGLNGGYGPLWLLVLYFIGGYIRKYDCFSHWRIRRALLIYLGCTVIGWGWRWLAEACGLPRSDLFCRYVSPNMVLAAVALLVAFSKLNIRPLLCKLIGWVAPLSFGVYIIHLHPVVFSMLFSGRFAFLANYPFLSTGLAAIGVAIGIFACCAVVDWLRKLLFQLLQLKKLSVAVGGFIEKKVRAMHFLPTKSSADIR